VRGGAQEVEEGGVEDEEDAVRSAEGTGRCMCDWWMSAAMVSTMTRRMRDRHMCFFVPIRLFCVCVCVCVWED